MFPQKKPNAIVIISSTRNELAEGVINIKTPINRIQIETIFLFRTKRLSAIKPEASLPNRSATAKELKSMTALEVDIPLSMEKSMIIIWWVIHL